MKILITNNALSKRTGSELYAKEVAEELKKRGHMVAAFSTEIGGLARQMREVDVEVVDDLAKLPWVPDIIHGQHHLETMIALRYFHDVPAIYVCHGWRPWQEKSPHHPRIMQYLAVDSKTFNFAVGEWGILPKEIKLIHNFVDLDRFQTRGSLPEKPKRALVFSNTANEGSFLPLVRQACKKADIELQVMGSMAGNSTYQPEVFLKNYDLVFAVGRSALEALATGVPVIICCGLGLGPMVQSKELEKLRDMNFGTAAIYSKLDSVAIYREILNYDSEDSARVTKKIRSLVGIESAVEELEKFYAEVIERYQTSIITPESEAHAESSYWRGIAISLKEKYRKEDQELILIKSSWFWKWMAKYPGVKKILSGLYFKFVKRF